MDAAIVYFTYGIPAPFPNIKTTEDLMYAFCRLRNNGSIVGKLENADWIGVQVAKDSKGVITLGAKNNPGFSDVMACIDHQHIAVLDVANYIVLCTWDGKPAYPWKDSLDLGHVVVLVGYNLARQSVFVHDSLQADPSGQPKEYSWKSFQAARVYKLREVYGPALPYVENDTMAQDPNFTIDEAQATATCKSNGFVVKNNLYHQLFGMLAHPEAFTLWYGLPQENEHLDPDGWVRQRFGNCIAMVKPDNSACQLAPFMAYDMILQLNSDLAASKALVDTLQKQISTTKPILSDQDAAILAAGKAFLALGKGL